MDGTHDAGNITIDQDIDKTMEPGRIEQLRDEEDEKEILDDESESIEQSKGSLTSSGHSQFKKRVTRGATNDAEDSKTQDGETVQKKSTKLELEEQRKRIKQVVHDPNRNV